MGRYTNLQLQSSKNYKEENLAHWIHCIFVLEVMDVAAEVVVVAAAAAAALYVVTGGVEVCEDLTAGWTCD